MSTLRAPTKADLLDECSNLVQILLEDGIAPKTVRRWLDGTVRAEGGL
jgi:hypothetical protein